MGNEFPSRYQVEIRKKNYPPGTRIQLEHMADRVNPVPPGTSGTVELVDSAGQIHMKWDNGRTLCIIPETDAFHRKEYQEQRIGGMQL